MTGRDPSELLTLAPHMRGRMCYIIIKGLRDPNHIVRRKEIEVSCDRLLIKMGKIGILKSIKPGVWKLNIPYLRKIAYVVSDNLFDHLSDPEVMFEYKKKQGKYLKTRPGARRVACLAFAGFGCASRPGLQTVIRARCGSGIRNTGFYGSPRSPSAFN